MFGLKSLHLLPPTIKMSLPRKLIQNIEALYLLCAGNIPDADAWAATCWEATRAAEVKPNGEKMQGFCDFQKCKSRCRPNGERLQTPWVAICPFNTHTWNVSCIEDRLQTARSNQYPPLHWILGGFLNSYSKWIQPSISLALRGAKWFARIRE